ncbi:unnamed protein product [Urochloa humidicola]
MPTLMEEQSVAPTAARGVGEGRRVSGGSGGGGEEEEMYERYVDLAAAVGFVEPGPSGAPVPTPMAALFYPSPAPPQLAAGDGVVMGRSTAGDIAGHWNYNVSGEVAHLKRFELHLEKWGQDLKDREEALDRREREVKDAMERVAAYWERLELHFKKRQQFLDDKESSLNRQEQRVEAVVMLLEQPLQALKVKVQENTLGTECPLLQQLERKKDDDTCNWGLGFVTMTIVLNVLAFLRHIETLLPHGYFTGVILALSLLWALSSIFLTNKVSGRYRRRFSYHVARLICFCFSFAVLYVLYLMSA